MPIHLGYYKKNESFDKLILKLYLYVDHREENPFSNSHTAMDVKNARKIVPILLAWRICR